MGRPQFTLGPGAAMVLGSLVVSGGGILAQDDAAPAPPAIAPEIRFLEGLRERNYHDLALEYLGQLAADPKTPPQLKAVIGFEEGRCLLDEASELTDLDRRQNLLEQARAKLDGFVKANPQHPRVPEALVQMARLLFERGMTAAIQATEAEEGPKRNARLAEARASLAEARKAYAGAIEPLQTTYDGFPKFLPEGDPRIADRDRAHVALMDAELQKALVDYEEAQSFAPGSEQRNTMLDTARTAFQGVYNRYRTQLAGFFAHMWEAKCFEEKGQLGEAMGIYKELMEHPDPSLAPLKRKVMYFQIIVDGKRGEHALAADRAVAWLQQFPNAVRSDEGIGVRFELAKNLIAQIPQAAENEKGPATRRAVELLTEVVRFYSPFKPEAIALLKKYKPSAAASATTIANLSYDDAYSQAEAAASTQDWDQSIALLRQAIRKANPEKDADRANRARYLMAYCQYQAGRYYEAAVLAEHLARRYPRNGLSPKAAEIAMAAQTMAYNNFNQVDRGADLERLVSLADYAAKTYEGTDQGDAARVTLGEIELGRGSYEAAVAAFEGVRDQSPRKLEAMVKAGDATWRLGQRQRAQGKAAEADAAGKKAQELMEKALQARRDAKAPENDLGLLTNVNALAEIYRATGRPQDAIALLDPAVKALGEGKLSDELGTLRIGLLTVLLRAHIAAGQADAAIGDMKRLEAVGGSGAGLTQLYYELGQSLQKELDALASRNDPTSQSRFTQTRNAYTQFLQALAASQAGQTYDSLMFAGESLLGMNQTAEAVSIFDRVLGTFTKDAEFQKRPDASTRLVRTRLRRAEALRKQQKFSEAQTQLDEVLKLAPRVLEPMMEQGVLLEEWARAESSSARWNQAYTYWKALSGQLQRSKPRRVEYYEAIYHLAVALEGLGQKTQAASTLKNVMTLTPSVGSPEIKARYQKLLDQLTR